MEAQHVVSALLQRASAHDERRMSRVMHGCIKGMAKRTTHKRRLYTAARKVIRLVCKHLIQRSFFFLATLLQARRRQTTAIGVVACRQALRYQRQVWREWCREDLRRADARRHARILWLLYGMRTLGHALAGGSFVLCAREYMCVRAPREGSAPLACRCVCEIVYGQRTQTDLLALLAFPPLDLPLSSFPTAADSSEHAMTILNPQLGSVTAEPDESTT